MPGREEVTLDEDGSIVLNLWQPPLWQVDAEAEEPRLFLEHLQYLFDRDAAAINHILDWVAHLVQRPAERIDHALLITSEAKGIGKSTLGQIVKRLVGERNAGAVQTKELKSQFDGWFVGKLFVQVDEVYESGNWELANKLKSLITEPVIGVNVKYGPQMQIKNFVRIMMFSNHTAPLNLEDGDRRYFVFNSNAGPRSDDYYTRLHDEVLSDHGMNSVYSFLANHDLGHFNPHRRPPMTAAKQEIVEASGNPLHLYIAEATATGELYQKLGRQFSYVQLSKFLHEAGYGAHAKNTKELGLAVKAAGIEQVRRNTGHGRQRVYVLPKRACSSKKHTEPEQF
jgi:hypothetical protein